MGNWLYLNVYVIILIVQVPVNLVHIGRESLHLPPNCLFQGVIFFLVCKTSPAQGWVTRSKKPPAFSFHIISWGSAEYRFPSQCQNSIVVPSFALHDIYYRNTCLIVNETERDRREKSKIFRVTVTPGLAKMATILLYGVPELSLMQLEYNCDNNNNNATTYFNYPWLGASSVPDTILSTLDNLTHLFLMAAQWTDYYCPHFTGVEIEAKRERIFKSIHITL